VWCCRNFGAKADHRYLYTESSILLPREDCVLEAYSISSSRIGVWQLHKKRVASQYITLLLMNMVGLPMIVPPSSLMVGAIEQSARSRYTTCMTVSTYEYAIPNATYHISIEMGRVFSDHLCLEGGVC
jgi:hypothetical protein